jgi:hypothetical protein
MGGIGGARERGDRGGHYGARLDSSQTAIGSGSGCLG